MSDSLWPRGLQHARPPCPSPTPRVYSNSSPSSQWCHLTIILCRPLLLCLQSFPASGPFPVSRHFTSGGQSIRASAAASVLPMNIQDWFKINWFDLLAVQETLKSFLQHHSSKASILQCPAFFMVQLSQSCMTAGKAVTLTRLNTGKIMPLLFNMLSRLVIAFLPRSKCLLISGLLSTSQWFCSNNFATQRKKVCHCFYCFPIILPLNDGTGCRDLSFLNVEC